MGTLGRRLDRDGRVLVAGDHGVDLVVGPLRVVVEQDQALGSRGQGQAQGIARAGMAEIAPGRQFLVGVLGVVEDDVSSRDEAKGVLVVLPEPGRPRAEPVGQWSDR